MFLICERWPCCVARVRMCGARAGASMAREPAIAVCTSTEYVFCHLCVRESLCTLCGGFFPARP